MKCEITLIAFNYGNAGRYVNGPGMCLVNFVKALRLFGIKVNVFSKLKSSFDGVMPLSDVNSLRRAINRSSLLHHWSGIDNEFIRTIVYSNRKNLKVIIGPNVLDTVNFDVERRFLDSVSFDKILAVNERLKFKIAKEHRLQTSQLEVFLVGPDLEMWSPILDRERDETILWKGNSKHFVKDVNFALRLQKELPQYKFKFIGHPTPYNYEKHIVDAKRSKVSIVTSLSETMGLAMLEGWASSLPSISHPKIYMHGENYKTGIITSRSIQDYKEAIIEIMEDDELYARMKYGSREYALKEFSSENIVENYKAIIKGV